MNKRPLFITFEGIEGSGKSTMIGLLAEHLRKQGLDPVVTREPGGSSLGKKLRAMLLDSRCDNIAARAELMLFLADRAQHIAEIIKPALESGRPILCDRFIDSTVAYQGYGRGMDLEKLKQMNEIATNGLLPDLTLLFDLPVEHGLIRAAERNKYAGIAISEGRFEAECHDFHQRIRDGYLALAKAAPERIRVIDADQDPDYVMAACLEALAFAAKGENQ